MIMDSRGEILDVVAGWPGLVREIHVAVGDMVEQDQELFTFESMKMLSPVPAPASGRVTAIHVSVDEFVDTGARLLTIE